MRLSDGFKSLLSQRRVSFYSTATLTSKPYMLKKDSLYNRISLVGDPRASIVPILDQWINEGKPVDKEDLRFMVMKLKGFTRFSHALEISQWMSDRRYIFLSPGDVAVRLELISKVHGIEEAEKYFDNIPKQYNAIKIYTSLLKLYAHNRSVEKAEALMQKMKELGFAQSSGVYNAMLNLCFQVGQYRKMNTLVEEMKEVGVIPDKFTYRTLLSTYAATSNIDGIKKILLTMEEDPNVIMDWSCYAVAANGYTKAGLTEKALELLQKSEETIIGKESRVAYDFYLTQYAAAGRKEDLYRIWARLRSSGKAYNTSYHSMIASLLKMDDFAGAENTLEEWEARDISYDFSVPNLLISAYCKKGNLEKAEMLLNRAIAKGEKPFGSTWDLLARGYIEANEIPKAVEVTREAFLAGQRWKPSHDTLAACMVYLKQLGDAEKVEEFVRVFKSNGDMSPDDCERLLDHNNDTQAGMT